MQFETIAAILAHDAPHPISEPIEWEKWANQVIRIADRLARYSPRFCKWTFYRHCTFNPVGSDLTSLQRTQIGTI